VISNVNPPQEKIDKSVLDNVQNVPSNKPRSVTTVQPVKQTQEKANDKKDKKDCIIY
jgi:hypothetical protein